MLLADSLPVLDDSVTVLLNPFTFCLDLLLYVFYMAPIETSYVVADDQCG